MPIYEFYCSECTTVYKFFSKSINTDKVPSCPHCENARLERKVSMFATISGTGEEAGDDSMPNIDEAKMEQAMGMLASEAENLNEDDPRQAAQLMRKLSDATGLKMGAGMEEALHRMEQGEDPEKIEEEMGDLLEGEEPFALEEKSNASATEAKPNIDETIYDL